MSRSVSFVAIAASALLAGALIGAGCSPDTRPAGVAGDAAAGPEAGAGDVATRTSGENAGGGGVAAKASDSDPAAQRSALSAQVPANIDPLYEPWARVLSTYVDQEGLVDYAGLKERGRADLGAFMTAIAEVDPATLGDDAAQIAFWANAYNATVLWQVIEVYPIDSVRDVGALWGLVGGFFKKENRIARVDRSLDDIEHGILRADFPDPRIHWTLVCAAFGCPRLLQRPYVAADLDPLLTELAYEFLTQPRALQVDREAGTLHLSRYFDWYGGDFEAESGTIVDYVLRYAPPEAADWIREHREDVGISFMDYDWTLNDQASGPRSRRRAPQ